MQAEAWRTHAGFAVPETRPRWRSLTPGKSSVRLGLAASPAVALDIHVRAEVAELADAHGSGPCTRKGVGVRVPSSAPVQTANPSKLNVRLLKQGACGLAQVRVKCIWCGQLRPFTVTLHRQKLPTLPLLRPIMFVLR
jgi:hypothetical protein